MEISEPSPEERARIVYKKLFTPECYGTFAGSTTYTQDTLQWIKEKCGDCPHQVKCLAQAEANMWKKISKYINDAKKRRL